MAVEQATIDLETAPAPRVGRTATMSPQREARPRMNSRTFIQIHVFSALFWTAMYVMHTTQMVLMNNNESAQTLAARFGLNVATFLLCVPLGWALHRTLDLRLGKRLALVAGLCIPLGALYSFLNYVLWYRILQIAELDTSPLMAVAWQTQYYSILFMLWAAFCSAMLYAARLQERERSLLQAQALAHEAELKMLRYQINPHFLFNTLNAVSALIVTGQSQAADAMVGKLALFFRNALSRESSAKVTLEEDVRVQLEYLSIEMTRFPDRLRWSTSIEPGLENALVPHLILQPLFENAIKHGVARSAGPVEIRLTARRGTGRLHLSVENEHRGEAAHDPRSGEGVGLSNVARRLASFYGPDASLHAQSREGMFIVDLDLPLEFTL